MRDTSIILSVALVGSLGVVAWGIGGYAPWATLVLELSAIALTGGLIAGVLGRTSRAEHRQNLAIARSRRRVFGKRPTADVEILSPLEREGTSSANETSGPYPDPFYMLGYPFRRVGIGLGIVALTLWIGASLVPLPLTWLTWWSPKAFELRSEVSGLLENEALTAFAPSSLTPFFSYQALLLWLAYAMLFWVSYHVADSSRAVRRLSLGLVFVGVASCAYGLVQWLSRLSSAVDEARVADYLTTGSFGNRNHYALFQEMLLLVSLGWLVLRSGEAGRRARDRASAQEAKARTALIAAGTVCIALGLLFSFSRSGISFAIIAGAFFFYATRNPSRKSRRVLVVPALFLLAGALWIGIDPLVSRFSLAPEELTLEGDGRATVWRDSLGAVSDFWLTGSGLGSFRHVYPIYRSFGGRRFYSWAHNDYLQLAVELGLPGLLLIGLVIFWIVRRGARVRTSLEGQRGLRDLHAGYCAAALAVGLHSFTDFGLHLPANAALLAVVLGVVTGLTPKRRSRENKVDAHPHRRKLRRSPPAA